MYIEAVPNRNSPPAILLRESFRAEGRVRKRTLANLSDLAQRPRRGLSHAAEGRCGGRPRTGVGHQPRCRMAMPPRCWGRAGIGLDRLLGAPSDQRLVAFWRSP